MTRRYITVALPYVNGRPHVGHLLELVQADVLARWYRARSDEVRLHGGTDDNSLKNALAAEEARLPVADFVADNAARFRELARLLRISFDDYIHTSTDLRHATGVEHLWRLCADAGDLYKASYSGRYCVGCEQFYASSELIDGHCSEHLAPAEPVEEVNWFFRLSRYAEQLDEAITSGRLEIVPEVYRREVLSFVRSGLADISVSRSRARARSWGLPVPGDDSQVIYVWWDALANYVTALEPLTAGGNYGHWWERADQRNHLVGKGIVRFHAVYWPAFLLSAGLPLPTRISVHPYLTADGAKLSKSARQGPSARSDPAAIVARHGADALRWWLCSAVPQAADTDFTEQRLVNRVNAELAGGVGNLASRALTLVQRLRAGVPPPATPQQSPFSGRLLEAVGDRLDAFDLRGATERILDAVAEANRYLEAVRPWELAADDPLLDECLAHLLAELSVLAEVLAPFVPATAARLELQLTPEESGRLPAVGPLFPRHEGRFSPANQVASGA